VLLLATGAGYGIYSYIRRTRPFPFSSYSATPVTDFGNVVATALSSDGKFLVSILRRPNIPTGSDTIIVDAGIRVLDVPVFSPDSSYIYFRESEGVAHAFDLLRAPLLGARRKSSPRMSIPMRRSPRTANALFSLTPTTRRSISGV
jgi:hypothetical protein